VLFAAFVVGDDFMRYPFITTDAMTMVLFRRCLSLVMNEVILFLSPFNRIDEEMKQPFGASGRGGTEVQ
jgi:hypothetical protein